MELGVGVTIKIKRSDGRVHDALITGVDSEKNLVSVEWSESDETKGKEIEVSQVLYLNPNVYVKPVVQKVTQSKLQAPPPRRQTNISPYVSGLPQPSSGIPKPHPSRLRNVENIISSNPKSGAPPLVSSTQCEEQPFPPKKESGIGSVVLRNKSAKQDESGIGSVVLRNKSAKQDDETMARKLANRVSRNSQYGGMGVVFNNPPPSKEPAAKDKAIAVGGANRKSQVVKEVDDIKKKRDERRVKNAEIRHKKKGDYDADNPNWEFAGMVRDYRQTIEMNPLRSLDDVIDDRICVCVRKRPLSKKETSKKETDIVTIPEQRLTMIHEPKTKVDLTKYLEHHNFRFDYSFDEAATNEMIYHYSARNLVNTIFSQGMATCFAYGQTGSGKTHTMGGTFSGKEQDSTKGIYALAAGDVFKLNRVTYGNLGLAVSASYFEIYCSKVFDLLNGKKRLRILEDAHNRVQVVGLEEIGVSSVPDVLQLIETGNRIRTSGTTSANQNSSRSHAVFQLILRKKGSSKVYGKLSLIDLAGNERGADTSSSDRKTRQEGAEINKSLLALKECIRALGKKGVHLPFRGSTLTQVLRDSFIGPKAKTCMIATISPGLNCCEHTLNTLRYAERVKDLPGKRNPQPSKGPTEDHHTPPVPSSESVNDRGIPNPDTSITSDEDLITDEVDPDEDDEFEGFEKSSELQNFHQVLSQLNELEEMLFAEHRELIQDSKDTTLAEERLLCEAESVDGNTEDYANKMIEIIDNKISKLQGFKEHLQDYQGRLCDEEAASRLLNKANHH